LRLTVLARFLRSDFDRHVHDAGLTRSQWSLIAVASSHPGSSQRQIAEILEMSEASTGRLIDRLEADGVLERRELEGDRRARAVFLTEAANPMLETMTAMARAREEHWFRGMSDSDLRQLSDLLAKLHNNINSVASASTASPNSAPSNSVTPDTISLALAPVDASDLGQKKMGRNRSLTPS
jgi:MarR family transcriptional regulator, transcriptional regulator for hemolysin